jgi:hypothetical protein
MRLAAVAPTLAGEPSDRRPASLSGPPAGTLRGEVHITEIDDSTYQELAGLSAGKLEVPEGALGLSLPENSEPT